MYATREYEDFRYNQLMELAADYGNIAEFWIDIPMILSQAFRHQLYDGLAKAQPNAVILSNHGFLTQGKLSRDAWPTDVYTYETYLPPYHVHPGGTAGHQPWYDLEGKKYYIPGEYCDTTTPHWFWMKDDKPKPAAELVGSALLGRARGCNYLLNAGPDTRGLIPAEIVKTLGQLRKNLDAVNA
jgi:alpha-L-fucosidase